MGKGAVSGHLAAPAAAKDPQIRDSLAKEMPQAKLETAQKGMLSFRDFHKMMCQAGKGSVKDLMTE